MSEARAESEGNPLPGLTVSIGGAAMRPGDTTPNLIAKADGALYQSKQDGRDRVSF